jgi:orotidine-5'-phosphate decarboxylase
MESAVRAAFEAGATLVTVHAWAGPVALKRLAEVEAELRQKRPFQLLVVSILTSFDAESLPHGMVAQPIAKHVEGLVEMAIGCGLTGFVCSAQELPLFKTSGVDRLADRFWVTPGIRMGDESAADQKRVTTPELAMSLGASAIVVARPIVDAPDPVQAADLYLRHLSTFQSSVKTTAQTSFDSPASGTATPAALASALGAHEGSSSERNGGRT